MGSDICSAPVASKGSSAPKGPVGEFERLLPAKAQIPQQVRIVGKLAQGCTLVHGLAACQKPVQQFSGLSHELD
jgi:hypothetical protein